MSIEINKLAPDFKLMGSDGKEHSLSDYKGTNIVLYFYPKDNTPGCTKQACGFSERLPLFLEKGAVPCLAARVFYYGRKKSQFCDRGNGGKRSYYRQFR